MQQHSEARVRYANDSSVFKESCVRNISRLSLGWQQALSSLELCILCQSRMHCESLQGFVRVQPAYEFEVRSDVRGRL